MKSTEIAQYIAEQDFYCNEKLNRAAERNANLFCKLKDMSDLVLEMSEAFREHYGDDMRAAYFTKKREEIVKCFQTETS